MQGSILYRPQPEPAHLRRLEGAEKAALTVAPIAAIAASAVLFPVLGIRGAAIAAAAAAGLWVFVLTAWRPAVGCVLLVVAVPLTAGLGRGTIVPLLRPGETIVLLVVGALFFRQLATRRNSERSLAPLDLVVAAFVFVVVLVPAAVLLFTRAPADSGDWLSLVGPVQFLIVYWIYSRAEADGEEIRWIVKALLITSVLVGLIGIVEAADVAGVRSIMDSYYPPPPEVGGGEPVYRARSTLEHFSALGAFATMNFILAFALLTARAPGFRRPWLMAVMLVNLGALVASQTWAAALALPVMCTLVCWHQRRLPPNLAPLVAILVVALILQWPAVSARFAQQQLFQPGQPAITLPHTMDFRIDLWQRFFIPALSDEHRIWFGTGTLLPSEIPESLSNFVDNEFLRMGFRAGVPGIVMLVAVQVVIFMTAWRARAATGWAPLLGAVVVASVAGLLLQTGAPSTMGG